VSDDPVWISVDGRECRTVSEGLDVARSLYDDLVTRADGLARARVRLGRALNELRASIPAGAWRESLESWGIPYHIAKRARRVATKLDEIRRRHGDAEAERRLVDAESLRSLELDVGARSDPGEVAPLAPLDDLDDETPPANVTAAPASLAVSGQGPGDGPDHDLPSTDAPAPSRDTRRRVVPGGGVPISAAPGIPDACRPGEQLTLGPVYEHASRVRDAVRELRNAARGASPEIAALLDRFELDLDGALAALGEGVAA
jgi:hypothetical protein